jgi:hypothetical protein
LERREILLAGSLKFSFAEVEILSKSKILPRFPPWRRHQKHLNSELNHHFIAKSSTLLNSKTSSRSL